MSSLLDAEEAAVDDELRELDALQGDVQALCEMCGTKLHGAKLPPPTRGAPPLASGFYPTDLAASFHAHRERWTFYHTQLAPSMPSSRSLPMVGTFLTGDASVVYLDGVKLKIEAR